ncbi:FMN-linked oxidoreductase [Aaosphaeria arxii CBS 175.79]|uniref:FMN-linked oxidoreductase n=1 Tax=Aaosphaeria arxii CBS 175.79 TaxID=1450172 RepID=A0A6A5Y3T2_9PLEO|nr:FMN-linked oxidoreductase [Aaosphaeria arxii CBS 175.79]KAF2019521.1 FMN-linked oxidoreductase [Aaosphaeria arxii CBS 175.79]
MASSKLFQPLKVGNITLKNRVAMAPLTRFRADENHVPLPFVADYYAQRASVPGTLLVTEATFISPQAGGYGAVPAIHSQAQIDGWKKVTEAVHAKGSYIYLQLWALGRVADPKTAEKEGITIRSSSAVALEGHATPKELTIDEIKSFVQEYAQAAKNAIAAGFDGVEIHGANGYLIDQFNQDTVNQRTDAYGGSVENRSRFAIEVTEAVVNAVGADRTGIRLSPFSTFQGMKMKDPISQFSDIVSKLDKFGLAYVHLVESRVSGNADVESTERISPLVDLFRGPVLVAGGFKPDSAKALVDKEYPNHDVVVVFGRYFISTPDLVFRLKEGIELNPYDRNTFYNAGEERGYTDYPFSKEFSAASSNL